MVDQKTLQSHNQLSIINQNHLIIITFSHTNICNSNFSKHTQLDNPNLRSNNLSSNLPSYCPINWSNQQRRHRKPKRNAKSTRTTSNILNIPLNIIEKIATKIQKQQSSNSSN